MRKGKRLESGAQVWYFKDAAEMKQSAKRYKANGIPTQQKGEEFHIIIPETVTLIYRIDPIIVQEEYEQLSFYRGRYNAVYSPGTNQEQGEGENIL